MKRNRYKHILIYPWRAGYSEEVRKENKPVSTPVILQLPLEHRLIVKKEALHVELQKSYASIGKDYVEYKTKGVISYPTVIAPQVNYAENLISKIKAIEDTRKVVQSVGGF
jgi:hypothetical protein